MAEIFTGLAAAGFWGCFDEFNRINPEVLSVVSQQITEIQHCLRAGLDHVTLLENTPVSLKHTIAIYITMNPG